MVDEELSELRKLWEEKISESAKGRRRPEYVKERFDYTNKNILAMVNGEQALSSDTTLLTELAGFLGLTEEQLRIMQEQACVFNAQKKAAQYVTPSEAHADQKTDPAKAGRPWGLVSMFAGLVVVACATGVGYLNNENTTNNESGYCTLSFDEAIPVKKDCSSLGTFNIEASVDEIWYRETSLLIIPKGWEIVALYETWLKPDYKENDPEREGFVKMTAGEHHLDNRSYRVFHDFELTEFKKQSATGELNDRLQYLVILKASEGELLIQRHDQPNHNEFLRIKQAMN